MVQSREITLMQLRALVALDEERSLAALARRYDRTPIALRSMFHRLAAACGESKPLFVSDGSGGVTLTDAGQKLLVDAKRISILVDEMTGRQRRVVVAAYSTIMLQLFRAYADLGKELPFDFMPDADAARAQGGAPLTERLHTYHADIVIAPAGEHPEFQQLPLYAWKLRAITKDKPTGKAISIKALAGRELLVSPKGHRSRSLLEESAAAAGIELAIRLELADHGVMREIASTSDWVAVIPDDAFGKRHQNFGDEIRRASGAPMQDRYVLYTRKDSSGDRDKPHAGQVAEIAFAIRGLLRANPAPASAAPS